MLHSAKTWRNALHTLHVLPFCWPLCVAARQGSPTCDAAWVMGGTSADSPDRTGSGRLADAASTAAPAALVPALMLSCLGHPNSVTGV